MRKHLRTPDTPATVANVTEWVHDAVWLSLHVALPETHFPSLLTRIRPRPLQSLTSAGEISAAPGAHPRTGVNETKTQTIWLGHFPLSWPSETNRGSATLIVLIVGRRRLEHLGRNTSAAERRPAPGMPSPTAGTGASKCRAAVGTLPRSSDCRVSNVRFGMPSCLQRDRVPPRFAQGRDGPRRSPLEGTERRSGGTGHRVQDPWFWRLGGRGGVVLRRRHRVGLSPA